jgi:hypothetical protein
MASKKQRRVKHLNDVPAKVHLRAGKLRVIVEIPWDGLARRLRADLETGMFRKKRKSRRA